MYVHYSQPVKIMACSHTGTLPDECNAPIWEHAIIYRAISPVTAVPLHVVKHAKKHGYISYLQLMKASHRQPNKKDSAYTKKPGRLSHL
jgi:hypothetical protein